jgi:hypothetical protein
MAYDDPYIAGAVAQLSWHISTDGILYAREMQTGVTYKMIRMTAPGLDAPAPKITDAPVDGQLYGRQDASWKVVPESAGITEAPADSQTYGRQDNQWTPIGQIPTAAGVVITTITPTSALEGSSVTITVNGTGFTSASVISWGGFPLVTTFIDNTTLEATVNLGPGSAGIYTVVVTDGNALSNSVAFAVNPVAAIFSADGVSCTLGINRDGDLIITQTQGPNAGKSVNLTYGKWS